MLNLIIFGSPGAGKGTQAVLIAKKYNLNHLSSGEILRRELNNIEFGKKIKRYQNAGKLVPNNLVIKMVEEEVTKKISGGGFVFDGYPRNLKQAKALDKLFQDKNLSINLVINLKLSEREAVQRIMLRSKTSGRSDDNLKTIENRFTVYHAQTTPLLKYYHQQKKVINLDGRLTIPEISRQIKQILTAYKKTN
ncbi:MAG: adenylate kinase [Patescibacteria group bacterium]|jgi:adenylate kinase